MGNNTVGACTIDVESYKCSINNIGVSTVWESPTGEVAVSVLKPVFDNQKKTSVPAIYLITSSEGKKVTIKTNRAEAKCQRDNHKKCVVLINDGNPKEEEIVKQKEVIIKYYKIEGPYEPFMYVPLNIPLSKKYSTLFKYTSCKEGLVQFRIISYPDIKFKLEFSLGAEAKKHRNKTSPFERKTAYMKYVPQRLEDLKGAFKGKLIFSPSLSFTTTYNGGKEKIEMTINFDTDKEIFHFTQTKNNTEFELGLNLVQNIPGFVNKIIDLCKLIKKVSETNFLDELTNVTESLVNNYKPYQLSMAPPNVLLCLEGKYAVSQGLTKIGRYYEIGIATVPFINISLKVDLLFLILSGVSGGSAVGFLLILKKLDKVIEKLLGRTYKKKYKDTKPFEADIYFNFIITGAINGSISLNIDTTAKVDSKSFSGYINGTLKADLEAGAKCKVDILIVAVEGEMKGSASTGIKIELRGKNNILQGKGVYLLLEGIFMGLKLSYCVTGKVGMFRTVSKGGDLLNGDATLLERKTLFSKDWTLFQD